MARILIVEDEPPINELICRNLLLVGHESVQVYDGIAAIDETQKQSFDLIILDILLPRLNGFEVIEKINNIPVIFLTAKDGLSDRVKGHSRKFLGISYIEF